VKGKVFADNKNTKEKYAMETTDIMERTLAQEKGRYDKFCKIMHIFSTLMSILFAAGAVFSLVVPIIQAIQYRNNGGKADILSVLVSVIYVFLVLGGIALMWNSARHIFRRLRTSETPFCYDIADKIKGTGFLAILLGIISLVYRAVVELISKNGGNFVKSDGYMDLGYPFIYSVLILGVVLMIIAYVFNYGCKLQQEADETL
jgi:predicted PurR-regulated permease PerM